MPRPLPVGEREICVYEGRRFGKLWGESVQEGTDYLPMAFILMENNTERGELQGKIAGNPQSRRESPVRTGICGLNGGPSYLFDCYI